MKKKYIRLLITILGLALMVVTVAHAQEGCQDLTYILDVKGRGIAKLSMYDMNGRIVHETRNSSLERIKIDLTDISKRIRCYFS